MTTMTDPPQSKGFRLSQLIYDTRYRSITIQTIAMIAFMGAIAYLARNTIINLENLGKDISFGFLSSPANYDINQQLIPYESSDTHLRAATVGLLNTLLIAVLGCTLATIIGVVAGVLRLSNNWLTARIMTVYVESFRNIPVLIWILVFMAVFSEALPQPPRFPWRRCPEQHVALGYGCLDQPRHLRSRTRLGSWIGVCRHCLPALYRGRLDVRTLGDAALRSDG